MGKIIDPLAELREIKRKIGLELGEARKKGKLLEKLQEMDRQARKLLRSRKKTAARR